MEWNGKGWGRTIPEWSSLEKCLYSLSKRLWPKPRERAFWDLIVAGSWRGSPTRTSFEERYLSGTSTSNSLHWAALANRETSTLKCSQRQLLRWRIGWQSSPHPQPHRWNAMGYSAHCSRETEGMVWHWDQRATCLTLLPKGERGSAYTQKSNIGSHKLSSVALNLGCLYF